MTMRLMLLAACLLLFAGPSFAQEAGGVLDLDSMMQEMLQDGPETAPDSQAEPEEKTPEEPVPGPMPTFTLDEAPTPKPAEPIGFLGELLDHATFQVEAYGKYFFQEAEGEDVFKKDFQAWSRVAVESHASVTDGLLFDVELRALYSNVAKGHRGAFSDPNDHTLRARYVDFDTLSLTWEQPDYSVLVGRSELSLGLTTLYSPADRFQNRYGVEPPEGYDTGVWQAHIDYFLGDDMVRFAVAPFDNRTSNPHDTSRWIGSSGNYYFSALDLPAGISTLRDYFRSPTVDNWSYLLSYEGVRPGYDFFVAGHFGPSTYPVVRQVPGSAIGEVVLPRAGSMVAGFAATRGRWEFHGEGVYQLTLKNRDQDFLKYVLGVSYRETDFANSIGLEELNPVIEYAGEVVTDQQTAPVSGYVLNSADSRPFRDAVLGRLDIRVDSEWSGSVGGTYNLVDKDASVVVNVEYEYSDNLEFNADVQFYSGEGDTQFGRWRKNDLVHLGVVWNF